MSDIQQDGGLESVADDTADTGGGEDQYIDNFDDAVTALAADDEEGQGDEPDTAEDGEDGEPTESPVVVTLSDGTQVPLSELEGGLYRQADYTKKTTELAKEREAVQEIRASYEQREQAFNATYQRFAAFVENLVPPAPPLHLAQSDPNQYTYQVAMRQQAIAELQGLMSVQEDMAGLSHQASQEDMGRHRAAEDANLVKAMPELKDPARRAKFDADNHAFALSLGFTEDQISNTVDHRLLRTIHLASIGAKAIENRANAQRRVEPPRKGAPVASAPVSDKSKTAMRRFHQTGLLDDAVAAMVSRGK